MPSHLVTETKLKEKKNVPSVILTGQDKTTVKEQQVMKDARIQIRVSTIEKERIESAAAKKGETLTNYVLTSTSLREELSEKLDLIIKRLDALEEKLK